jgi:hypothetical protein
LSAADRISIGRISVSAAEAAATEVAEQGQHDDHDDDDPEQAHDSSLFGLPRDGVTTCRAPRAETNPSKLGATRQTAETLVSITWR